MISIADALAESRVRVRIVTSSFASQLEEGINSVLEKEQANGAKLVDIKLTSYGPADGGQPGIASFSQPNYVALILLSGGRLPEGEEEAGGEATS